MGTKSHIMQQLEASERALMAMRLKSEEKKVVERRRLEEVKQTHQDELELHAKKVAAVTAEWEGLLAGIVYGRDKELEHKNGELAKARQSLEEVEAEIHASDREALDLRRQVENLKLEQDAAEAEFERAAAEAEVQAEAAVRQKMQEAKETIRLTGLYATEVQEKTLKGIIGMTKEAYVDSRAAPVRSQQRSRFKELSSEILGRSAQGLSKDISSEELRQGKIELIQAWLDDWHAQAQASVSSFPPEAAQAFATTSPLDPERPRSVERVYAEIARMQPGGVDCG